MLMGGLTGRTAGTADWAGLPNLRCWCDREKEVAGSICIQMLGLWVAVESELLKDLCQYAVRTTTRKGPIYQMAVECYGGSFCSGKHMPSLCIWTRSCFPYLSSVCGSAVRNRSIVSDFDSQKGPKLMFLSVSANCPADS